MLTIARDYARARGFKGTFLIEPKPICVQKRHIAFTTTPEYIILSAKLNRCINRILNLMTIARDYARARGFKGTFLIEPKPMEPTKHQYDVDWELVCIPAILIVTTIGVN